MKTLYLLRHAKAEPGDKNTDDRDRALSLRGLDACETVGGYLKAKGHAPELVITSPSARTKETSEKVLAAAGFAVPEKVIDKLYLATPDEMLHYIHLLSDKFVSAMLVGHNPGMHHLALVLAASSRTPQRIKLELKYPTAALATLTFDCDRWQDVALGEGSLKDFVTPQAL